MIEASKQHFVLHSFMFSNAILLPKQRGGIKIRNCMALSSLLYRCIRRKVKYHP